VKVRYDHVTVFVIRPAGSAFEFLQLRRQPNDYLGGTWQTVRGTGEPGETSVQTALRELREETGLAPAEFYSLGIVETFYMATDDTIFHSPAFVAFVPAGSGVTLDSEHDAHRWISAADAERLFMWPSEAPLLREIRARIVENSAAKPHLRVKC
jgi:8-oxo-dGTP pyrophosphatase MutT (NUDIX family)